MAYSIIEIANVLKKLGILSAQKEQQIGREPIIRPKDTIEYLATDSRKISFAATSLFFALKTTSRDGFDFVLPAYESGVKNFVVEVTAAQWPGREVLSKLTGANLLFVTDTTAALQHLASHQRKKFNYPVIGITGSNGKTVVKEWLNFLLEDQIKIVRSPRSFNSQIGVPLSVWEMSQHDQLGIFEAGISTIGEMDKLQAIIQPTIGVLTNIGDAHDSGFESKKQKLAEKCSLFKGVKVLFYNGKDDWINSALYEQFKNSDTRLVRIGRDLNADIRLMAITLQEKQEKQQKQQPATTITVSFQSVNRGSSQFKFMIPFTDSAAVENAVTCLAVYHYLGLDLGAFKSKVTGLPAIDMRLQVLPAINRCTVINDSYSLDQHSLQVALDLLNQQLAAKTLILSDIPGLKADEKTAAYQQMAALILNKQLGRLITIGPEWKNHAALLRVPLLQQYDSTAAFVSGFQPAEFKDEAILLKGARRYQFERIFNLLQEKVHQTRLEINLTAIVHNQKVYKALLRPGVKMMAMVKAFAYGSGLLEMASVLQYHNIDYLAVAYVDEAVALRNGGITVPIMVMNVDEYGFEALSSHQLEPEIYSFRILRQFMGFLNSQGLSQYPVHIKLDTGMHRLGFDPAELRELAQLLSGQRTVYVKSVFSHFTSSEDERDDAFTLKQANLLLQGCDLLEKALGYKFIRHIANTAAIARFPRLQLDMVRLGIGLYGINTTNEKLPIRTVATLKATIAQIRELAPGQTVGYNKKGKVEAKTRVATISIGYADGFSRLLSNGKGNVLLHGKRCPVIGHVCMDMTMININAAPEAKEGDEVEIFGPELPVEEMAVASATTSYEIFTSIGQRINRIYVED